MLLTLKLALKKYQTGLELSEYALGAGFMAIAVAMAFGELGARVSVGITGLISTLAT